jgi:hypothetical protein
VTTPGENEGCIVLQSASESMRLNVVGNHTHDKECHNLGCSDQKKGLCTAVEKCGLVVDYKDTHIRKDFTEDEVDAIKLKTLKKHNVIQ